MELRFLNWRVLSAVCPGTFSGRLGDLDVSSSFKTLSSQEKLSGNAFIYHGQHIFSNVVSRPDEALEKFFLFF